MYIGNISNLVTCACIRFGACVYNVLLSVSYDIKTKTIPPRDRE